MEKELKDLKSVLRSIVVSSPAQVDVRSLQRDYMNMMGSPLPIDKYGYRDVLEFLKERCNDCFLFQGQLSNPVLTLIVPESLKHIDQFVRNQKPSSVTKVKGKRRSVNETNYEKSNLVCQTFNTNHESTQHLRKSQPVLKSPDVKKDPIKSNHTPTNNISTNRKDLTESSKSISNGRPDSGYLNSDSDIVENGHHGNVRNFFKKRLPMYDSSQYLDSEACSEPDKVSSKCDDSGRQTSSSQSSTKKAQLEVLKREIHDLIKEHEEGIWCTDLMRLYRERYERELNFNRFGHNNINSLLCAMEDRVAFSSEARGVRLRVAARAAAPGAPPPLARAASGAPPPPARVAPGAPPPPAPPPPARVAPGAPPPPARAAPRPPSLRALPVDPDDALPGIDFEPDVFPADCMHFLESIPALPLAELQPGCMLEVTVGEVYSPSHFWLQRLGERYNVAMDEIMDEMSAYYDGAGRARVLARGAVRPGHYCSSEYERDWHRSLIIKVLDADTVKVRHVDYGTVDTVAAGALKPLLRRWARLPAQAARARLAGLRPGAAGRRWPHAAAVHFLHLVRDRRLVANVVAVDAEEDTIETFLIDTSGADDVCLTSEMIRSGHADARADSALRVSGPAGAGALDVRTLASGILQFGRRDDSASDVSASASELVGAPPRRMRAWEPPPASELSSKYLAHVYAQHKLARVSGPPSSPTLLAPRSPSSPSAPPSPPARPPPRSPSSPSAEPSPPAGPPPRSPPSLSTLPSPSALRPLGSPTSPPAQCTPRSPLSPPSSLPSSRLLRRKLELARKSALPS